MALDSIVRVSDSVVAEIISFGSLPSGWHYGSGTSFRIQTIVNALINRSFLRDLGLNRFEAFPRVDGSIVVAAYQDDYTINVTCYENSRIDILVEHGDHELVDVEGVPREALPKYIKGLGWKEKERSGYSIRSISLGKSSVSTAKQQEYLTTAYRSSTKHVQSAQMERNAIISRYSTPTGYPAIHLASPA